MILTTFRVHFPYIASGHVNRVLEFNEGVTNVAPLWAELFSGDLRQIVFLNLEMHTELLFTNIG